MLQAVQADNVLQSHCFAVSVISKKTRHHSTLLHISGQQKQVHLCTIVIRASKEYYLS